ncbi:hypothetical protein B0H13DRAFT_1916894 [Mycena leptocephala]|nr:hypothetical protein B0H13DRAFT_1916894 [Mycena leptocephala]
MGTPSYLEQAFPHRSAEERPSIIYYTPDGQRQEVSHSVRSSYGAGPEFRLPENPQPIASRVRPRSQSLEDRAKSPERRSRSRERRPERDSVPAVAEATHHWGIPLSNEGLLSSTTPFKDPSEFFLPASPRDSSYATAVPGPNLPDPLRGMASRQAYEIPNESISQASKGKGKADIRTPTRGQASNRRSVLERVSELDEDSFHANYAGRDLPPHMEIRGDREQGERESGRQRDTNEPPSGMPRPYDQEQDKPGTEHSVSRQSREPERERETGSRMQAGAGGGNDPSDDDDGDDADLRRDRRHRSPRGPPPPRRRRTPPLDRRGRGRSRSPPGPPPTDPSDGGSSSSSSSAGGRSDHRFPYVAPGAPYGTLVPTIEPKMKVESLPEWDGNHDTAIDYFWEVSQIANLQGWIPKALGFWLPTRLKTGSQIQLWFSTLPVARQVQMRGHYLTYLQVIKDRYLGKKWQLRMNLKFEQQSFRQPGHEKESPQKFLGRHTQYVRLLANTDDGGPLEVFLIMRKAPIAWSTILVLENIKSTEELYKRINDHEEELVERIEEPT